LPANASDWHEKIFFDVEVTTYFSEVNNNKKNLEIQGNSYFFQWNDSWSNASLWKWVFTQEALKTSIFNLKNWWDFENEKLITLQKSKFVFSKLVLWMGNLNFSQSQPYRYNHFAIVPVMWDVYYDSMPSPYYETFDKKYTKSTWNSFKVEKPLEKSNKTENEKNAIDTLFEKFAQGEVTVSQINYFKDFRKRELLSISIISHQNWNAHRPNESDHLINVTKNVWLAWLEFNQSLLSFNSKIFALQLKDYFEVNPTKMVKEVIWTDVFDNSGEAISAMINFHYSGSVSWDPNSVNKDSTNPWIFIGLGIVSFTGLSMYGIYHFLKSRRSLKKA
jgi:hypothetical protein